MSKHEESEYSSPEMLETDYCLPMVRPRTGAENQEAVVGDLPDDLCQDRQV